MPVLMLSAMEIVDTMLARLRELSAEIRLLADLKQKPLDPGESVAARHHKIASLGLKLAEAFGTLDAIVRRDGQADGDDVSRAAAGEPTPDTTRSN